MDLQRFVSQAVAAVIVCVFACNSPADTPQIRIALAVTGKNGDDARMVSALSHEFRKLDGVSVTEAQPMLKIYCIIMHEIFELRKGGELPIGYSASVVVTTVDGQFVNHVLLSDAKIDELAHDIAVDIDGSVIEKIRRSAQPSSSP
ncbi:MAG TPA: hypothetical protein VFA51_01015 [Candidatus Udaeobacter sp.]|nr:hypothetical protein [Candidatus Udaeobacter sp.]